MATKSIKKRHWAFVLYPESAPSDWRDRLQSTGLPYAVSPLHDKDLDPTGDPKKAHYHIILCFSGPTTYNAVKSITDGLQQPIPQPLESVRGYYRYLTHEDNPDKYQYDKADITTCNGFDIADFVELTKSEVTKVIKEIQTAIIAADIREYCDLLDYLLDYNSTWYDVAVNHTITLNAYLKSRRFKLEKEGIAKKRKS